MKNTLNLKEGQIAYITLYDLNYPEKVKLISKHIDTYNERTTIKWLVVIESVACCWHELVNENLLTLDDTEYNKYQVKKELLVQREEIDNKLRNLNV